jgi:hypothetical protein
MWLKMYLGKIFLSQWEMFFEYHDSVQDRVDYVRRMISLMKIEYDEVVGRANEQPTFVLHADSKINLLTGDECSWYELKKMYQPGVTVMESEQQLVEKYSTAS